jgi:alpha-ketoglutarate-dependent taurine dioxygenase
VVWDNRCLMHQATPWDMTQRRVMWHSRIAGDPASEAALAA